MLGAHPALGKVTTPRPGPPAWALGESDVMAKLPDHASPAMAKVYEILTVEESFSDEG